MKSIVIAGGGFSGLMTGFHLVNYGSCPFELYVVDQRERLGRGVAYTPVSKKHLLNVAASKMSAFHKEPLHFLNWLQTQEQFRNTDSELLAQAFVPRYIYGHYLDNLWNGLVETASKKGITIQFYDDQVIELQHGLSGWRVNLKSGSHLLAEEMVIATGNHLPGHPQVNDKRFVHSPLYHQNPWTPSTILGVGDEQHIVIIGNGLTMVDMVLSLEEHGFKGRITSLSPNGFNILPHRHGGMKYTKLEEDLKPGMNLRELLAVVHKHIKQVRAFGVSAEPVIDALRAHTPVIWQGLSERDKRLFMSRLRHLWGVARHRIPVHIHDHIQYLRLNKQMEIVAGKLTGLLEESGRMKVSFKDRKSGNVQTIFADRVINCTGPQSDIEQLENHFLKKCLEDGIVVQDELKLGIEAHPESYRVKSGKGSYFENLYTIGPNLRGIFWESTAVNELRQQAERLGKHLAEKAIQKESLIQLSSPGSN